MRLKLPLGGIARALFRVDAFGAKKSGLFGNLLLSNPEGFDNLAALVERNAFELVREIIQKNKDKVPVESSTKTTVAMVDDLSNEICCAADLAECTRSMHCDGEFSEAAEHSMRKYTALVETLNTTPELYYALKDSLVTDRENLDEVDIRTAKLLLEDFENSGVHLDKEKREKFVHLSDEIFGASVRFSNGVDDQITISKEEASQFGFDFNQLSNPWRSSKDYRIRKFTHGKFFEHNDNQETHLRTLISSRDQLAKLTGFKTYAHRAQIHSVLRTYENVHSFLGGIIKSLNPMIEEEIDAVRLALEENSKNFDFIHDSVGEWDLDFARSILRGKILDDVGDLSRFFNFETILSGFETVVNRLYGLSFKMLLPEPGETWPGNVLKLDVYTNNTSEFLGTIYLDMDIRSTKVQGDCHFTVRCSKLLDNGEYQTPIVVLSLSVIPLTKFVSKNPSMSVFENLAMDPQQAENFFHEMGHAIHSMLGRTRFQHVAGTRCPADFAEIPSHLMECFFNDPRVLSTICKDRSGRAMSVDEAETLIYSRNVFGGIRNQQQALYALFDLEIHGPYARSISDGSISSTDVFKKLSDMALPGLERTPKYAYHHRISHLVTYGAKYYSYLVARSSASLIYKTLFGDDPFSRENGLRWAKIQSHGGEYPSHHLLENILGKGPDAQQLTDVLRQTIVDGRSEK